MLILVTPSELLSLATLLLSRRHASIGRKSNVAP